MLALSSFGFATYIPGSINFGSPFFGTGEGMEGTSSDFRVATLWDTGGNGGNTDPNQYYVQINWGDSSNSQAMVSFVSQPGQYYFDAASGNWGFWG
jgi:hypothetical protein